MVVRNTLSERSGSAMPLGHAVKIAIYAFGDAFLQNGPGGRIGVYCPSQDREKSFRLPGSYQTGPRAALAAVNEAALMAQEMIKEKNNKGERVVVEILTNSDYAFNCHDSWIKNWEQNDWKTNKDTAVKHQDLIKETRDIRQANDCQIRIRFASNFAHTSDGAYAKQLAEDAPMTEEFRAKMELKATYTDDMKALVAFMKTLELKHSVKRLDSGFEIKVEDN